MKAVIYGQARRLVETTLVGYRDVGGGFEGPGNMRPKARRTIGVLLRGVLEEAIGS